MSSILDMIRRRRANKQATVETVVPADSQGIEKPADVQGIEKPVDPAPQVAAAEIPIVELVPVNVPTETAEKTETSEVPTDNGDVAKPVEEAQVHDDSKIETIPIGEDELTSLQLHNYEANKDQFHNTYVIEKMFWGHINSPDLHMGRKSVRVKRVVEVKAVSLVHALKLLGWDSRNITVASVKNEYKGEIAIQVDGKPVGKITIPADLNGGVPYEQIGGSLRNAYIAKVASLAEQDEAVKTYLAAKKRIVVGQAFSPRHHINLKTEKEPKAKPTASVPVSAPDAGFNAVIAAFKEDPGTTPEIVSEVNNARGTCGEVVPFEVTSETASECQIAPPPAAELSAAYGQVESGVPAPAENPAVVIAP